MLMSIAIGPGILQPSAIQGPAQIMAVSQVLRAVAENGIIVAPRVDTVRLSLLQLAAHAKGASSQRLQVLATEIAKRADHFVVAAPETVNARPVSDYALCATCATWGDVDAVIYLNAEERASLIDCGLSANLLVAINDFPGCNVDELRSHWRTTQRLDDAPTAQASKLVGRVIRYSKSITVADKMIGLSAKDSSGKLRKHLQGIIYLSKTWSTWSPYAKSGKLEVEIITIAGDSGARGGYLAPDKIRDAISNAIKDMDRSNLIGKLSVILKQDSNPQIFNDRLLLCGNRVWGVHHGLDDLGKLGSSTAKRPTMLDPHSEARHTVLRDIRSLSSADRTGPGIDGG